jgi:uncharacterized membrane protein required for colicin V production
MGILKRLTVIDFLFLFLALRIIYIAVLRGLFEEVFKTLGVFVSSLAAFHYYPLISKNIEGKYTFLNQKFFYFLPFLLIFVGGLLIFYLLRKIITIFLPKREISLKEKGVSLFVGCLRIVLLVSVIIFLLYLSPLKRKYLERSLSYPLFKNVAPKSYLISFKFYKKFNPKSKLNEEVERYYDTEADLSAFSKERH